MFVNKYSCILVVLLVINSSFSLFGMSAPIRGIDRVFLNACKNGASLDFSLNNAADMYAVDPENGRNGLHYACEGGHIESVRRILAELDERKYLELICAQDKQGRFPYDYAKRYGHEEIVNTIMNYALEIVIRANISSEEFVTFARGLIEKGADVNGYYGCRYSNALSTACALYSTDDDIAKISFLLDQGAHVNPLCDGIAPVFNALSCAKEVPHQERLKLITLLVERGADINAVDEDGLTLIHVASLLGDAPVVDFLIKKRIVLCRQDKLGQNELMYAIIQQEEQILKMLLNCNMIEMFTSLAQQGISSLHYAVRFSDKNIVKLVLDKMKELHIDINSFIDDEGKSPLHYASQYGSSSVVKMLLDAGANQSSDKKGITPLELSKKNKNGAQAIQQLLQEDTKNNNNLVKAAQGKKKKSKKKKKKAIASVVQAVMGITEDHDQDDKDDALLTDQLQELTLATVPLDGANTLTVATVAQPLVVENVSQLVRIYNADGNKLSVPKKSLFNTSGLSSFKEIIHKPFSYVAALRQGISSLPSQKITFSDDSSRATHFHIPLGSVSRDISFLQGYSKTYHVKEKQANILDHFHAVSDEQINLVVKYGELFNIKQNGKVECYRMPTTKDATSNAYTGYTEVFIKPKKQKVVHVFFNKNKETKALTFG